MAAGVRFTGYVADGALVRVMGLQQVRNVCLIRHAYVLPAWQGHGIAGKLIARLRGAGDRPFLVGTWRAAAWAICFYERYGFARVPDEAVAPLLRAYWQIPERQIDTSLVLAAPALSVGDAARLIAEA